MGIFLRHWASARARYSSLEQSEITVGPPVSKIVPAGHDASSSRSIFCQPRCPSSSISVSGCAVEQWNQPPGLRAKALAPSVHCSRCW